MAKKDNITQEKSKLLFMKLEKLYSKKLLK